MKSHKNVFGPLMRLFICFIYIAHDQYRNRIGTIGPIVVKTTPRTVTPPTARVPPTATLKGVNKGSAENNSHGASNAQIDDLSNQVNFPAEHLVFTTFNIR